MQNKIRVAQEQKVPVMLVLGDREVEARSATVRRRGAARDALQESLGWEALAELLAAEVAARRVD
jgi:threonyl-tRNA synthetase